MCHRTTWTVWFAALTLILFWAEPKEARAVQILYAFDTDTPAYVGDWLRDDGGHDPQIRGAFSIDSGPGAAAFGAAAGSFPVNPGGLTALQIPGTANLGTSFTLAASVNEVTNDFSRLFSAYNGGPVQTDEFVFDIDPSQNVGAGFGVRAIVNGTSVTRGVAFVDNQYHHLAMTYDNGNVRLFLDGAQLGGVAEVSPGPVELAYDLRFGEDYPPTPLTNEAFEGRADDVLVYDRVLSASEILSLHQQGAVSTLGGLPPPPPPPPPPKNIGSRIEMFVDTYLIDAQSNAALRMHAPLKQEIVFQANGPYETDTTAYYTLLRDGPQWRMYYRGYVGSEEVTLLSVSDDGVNFERPIVGVYNVDNSFANHIVWRGPQSHNLTPFIDTNPDAAPDARHKALGGTGEIYALKSADGVHWELMQPEALDMSGAFDSQNTVTWDEEAGLYRAFVRYWDNGIRAIQMTTSEDFINWSAPEPFEYDVSLEHFYTNAITRVPGAEQIWLGFPMRLDPSRTNMPSPGQTGVSDAVFITSRDGVEWDRTFLDPWIEEGYDTTRSNMPAWGIAETGEGEWSMYASERYRLAENRLRRLTMRPYGFGSIYADQDGGWFETAPLIFDGNELVLNFATSPTGSLAVEMRNEEGDPISGFTLGDSVLLTGDELAQSVQWTSGRSVGDLSGELVRLYFELVDADLFALQFRSAFSAADFNQDGFVDGDDFLLWQAGFGQFDGDATTNDGDADGDGFVDGDDFLIWQSEFGDGGGSAAAVPEPAAAWILILLAGTCGARMAAKR